MSAYSACGYSLSGIKVAITPDSVFINDETCYNFMNPFDIEIKKMDVSMSGHFVSVISDEGDLYLITMTTPGNIYVDLLQTSTKFKDSHFTIDETKLIALTDSNRLHYYSTLPTNFIQEYAIADSKIAESFRIVEANGIIQFTFLDEDGNEGEKKCMYLPENVQKGDAGITLVLKPAPESFLSLFMPIAVGDPEVLVQNEKEDDGEEDVQEQFFERQPESLEEAAQMLLEKSEILRKREIGLVGKRNMLARQVNELRARGDNIKRREEEAKARAREIFARLQALIEASDNGAKITQEEERLNDAERVMSSIDIPNVQASSEAVYEFRTGNFDTRLVEIKKQIDKKLNK